MMTPVELFWLRWHAQHGSPEAARQATALLSESPSEDAETDPAERRFLAETRQGFEAKRLGLFPRPALTLEALLEAAQVDLAHARQVAAQALTLFDQTQGVHNLPASLRPVLEMAALLHNVGVAVDEPRHHTAGRDLLMAMRLTGVTPATQTLLACTTRFHRKSVRPQKEPLFTGLNARRQHQTLALAALLRIADGLDYSQTQTTQITALSVSPETLTLALAGPRAEGDGERALAKADLWKGLFGSRWQIATAGADPAALAQQPLTAASATSTAAVRALADQHLRWGAAEAEARTGAPLALKAVRGAARRARAALDLFKFVFKKKPAKHLRGLLKQAEAALGEVRDWDVLIEQAAKELPASETWPFLDAWQSQRQAALTTALTWLESDAAGELHAALEAFLADPPVKPKADPPLAAGAATLLLASVENLAEYAAGLEDHDLRTYHNLRRLAIKRSRFALEFIAPALDDSVQITLKEIIKVQERLGLLNDACTARDQLTLWLAQHPEDDTAGRYRWACEARLQKHLRKFKEDWAPVQPELLRLKFAALLNRLATPPA